MPIPPTAKAKGILGIKTMNENNKDIKVDDKGYAIPPQKSFFEKLKGSIDKAKEEVSNIEVDKDGYVIPPKKSFGEKIREASNKFNNQAQEPAQKKVDEHLASYDDNDPDIESLNDYSSKFGDMTEDQRERHFDRQRGQTFQNNMSAEGPDVDLESMTNEARADHFAKEYFDEFGRIPTSFNNTYSGEKLELKDSDLKGLDKPESSLEI